MHVCMYVCMMYVYVHTFSARHPSVKYVAANSSSGEKGPLMCGDSSIQPAPAAYLLRQVGGVLLCVLLYLAVVCTYALVSPICMRETLREVCVCACVACVANVCTMPVCNVPIGRTRGFSGGLSLHILMYVCVRVVVWK
ncbi:hypothetical protein F4809DRAFT_585611 [Biscogniauxia mediterranea]|nr:hypothetical protein F4809DRAFT_585611 [Biscogniauxia mediterranea]